MIKGALPVGILGIGEPLIFGVTLPLGRPFIGACLGGAVGGALISYWKVATVITFGISGLPLALTIVSGKVMLYLAGMLITIIAGFLFTDDGVQRSRGVAFERQAATTGRRGAPRGLFDLDGTLHQEDMFGSFLRFLLRRLPLNLLLVIPLLLPIGLALLLLGRAARWPMSLLLWAITFGRSEAKLKALERQFIEVFRQKVTAFPVVQMRLRQYGGARCRSVADYRLAGAAGGAGVSRFGVSAAGTVDRQPHHAPLRRLGLDPALHGSAESGTAGAAARCAAEAVQRLQRQQAG